MNSIDPIKTPLSYEEKFTLVLVSVWTTFNRVMGLILVVIGVCLILAVLDATSETPHRGIFALGGIQAILSGSVLSLPIFGVQIRASWRWAAHLMPLLMNLYLWITFGQT